MNNKKIGAKTLVFFVAVIIVAVMLFAAVPAVFDFLGYVLWLLSPFVIAYLVSLLVNPMVNGLEKRFKFPRGLCAVIVIVLTVGVIGGVATAIVWKIIDEIKNIVLEWDAIYNNGILPTWERVSVFFGDFKAILPVNVQNMVSNLVSQVLDMLAKVATNTEIVTKAGNFAKKLPETFIGSVVFLLSLYFMITDSRKVSNSLRKGFSQKFLERLDTFRTEIKKYVGGYIKAQLTIMCISFTIIAIGLTILNVKYAPIIALGIAFLDALPFFGSGAVLWPWSAVAFIMSDTKIGIGLIIIYLCVILTRQFVEPKIVSKGIGIHPLVTLMSMYVGFKIFSLGGMILGPLVMVLIVSMYRTGIFDSTFIAVKAFFKKFLREIKNITNSLDDKENGNEK